jgi:flagellar hook-associated protein 2
MSTSGLSVNSTAGSPITVSGLASGLNTSSIIQALMSAERQPVTHLTDEQDKLRGEQTQLQSIQSSLQKLALAASEFSLPTQFEGAQTVTSSEPARVSAAASAGAAIGAQEIEVTQLADSAQRTFTFTSPAAQAKITIEGQEFTVKAGASAKELAGEINSDDSATVYAAVLGNGNVVLSSRATGSGSKFIDVSEAGGVLSEVAGSAKEGKNAEYKVDGVEGTSASNTVTDAIPGVTLTLDGLTTTSGPVTIDVQPAGLSDSAVEAKMQSFVKLYNSTIEAIQKELATKTVAKPQNSSELATGSLFGDTELESLLDTMRQAMYEPIAELPAEMSSPADIGLSTGAATGGTPSQASIEGQLELNTAKLSEALKSNPAGVQKMLEGWGRALQSTLTGVAEPGGTLEARINGDSSQITQLGSQIAAMNEMLLQREKALQATYAELEGVISKNTAQGNWLTSQQESLDKSGL